MIARIWHSFRALPGWVQLWVAFVLVPVNLAPLAFVGAPQIPVIAALALGGMLPNLVMMLVERGFSKVMALSHVVLWTPLVVLIGIALAHGADDARLTAMLWLLLVVDLISLGFDYTDARAWLRGDCAVAGAAQG